MANFCFLFAASLASSQSNDQLHLKSVFFLLKATRPCTDWVSVKTDNTHWGVRCGYNPKESLFKGKNIEVKFKTDDQNQEMGFWMKLSGKLSNQSEWHVTGMIIVNSFIRKLGTAMNNNQTALRKLNEMTYIAKG